MFSNPLWLFAMPAVLIPILIHLWNRQETKLIKVGSIKWLQQAEAAASERSQTGTYSLRNLQIHNWPLLLVRCLLVVTGVLLLSAPYLLRLPEAAKPWVLVSPELSEHRSTMQKVDSLAQAGFETHLFSKGFPLRHAGQPRVKQVTPTWELLQELESQKFSNAIVFEAARLSLAFGHRVAGNEKKTVRLIPVPVMPEPQFWLAEARTWAANTWLLTGGQTDRKGIYYRLQSANIPAAPSAIQPEGFPVLQAQESGKGWQLGTQGRNDIKLAVEGKKTWHVAVFFDNNRREDAFYVQNALHTAAAFSNHELKVELSPAGQLTTVATFDAVFYLSGKSIPKEILPANASPVWWISDAGSAALQKTETTIYGEGQLPGRLKQRSKAVQQGNAVWKDGFGEPLLQKTGLQRYQFLSRFHPDYCTIAEDPAFARWILELLFPMTQNKERDERAISTAQLLPQQPHETTTEAPLPENREPLQEWIWLLLLLLFGVERGMSRIKIKN